MQPYYNLNPSVYATNVIEIADSFPSQSLQPNTSPSAAHHVGPFSLESTYKKRKMERACDTCRRRKTKCDGPHMPDNNCTNCIQNRKICSYMFVHPPPIFVPIDFFPSSEVSKPRGPPKASVCSSVSPY